MQQSEIKLKEALEKLRVLNVLKEENMQRTLNDVEILKQKLKPLTKEELNEILSNIPKSEIEKIKNQLY